MQLPVAGSEPAVETPKPIGRADRVVRSGYDEFDRLTALVRRTHAVIDALLERGELPEGGADFLSDMALPHLERVEAGFRSWLRPGMAGADELRYLVLQVGPLRASPPLTNAMKVLATSAVEVGVPKFRAFCFSRMSSLLMPCPSSWARVRTSRSLSVWFRSM